MGRRLLSPTKKQQGCKYETRFSTERSMGPIFHTEVEDLELGSEPKAAENFLIYEIVHSFPKADFVENFLNAQIARAAL